MSFKDLVQIESGIGKCRLGYHIVLILLVFLCGILTGCGKTFKATCQSSWLISRGILSDTGRICTNGARAMGENINAANPDLVTADTEHIGRPLTAQERDLVNAWLKGGD